MIGPSTGRLAAAHEQGPLAELGLEVVVATRSCSGKGGVGRTPGSGLVARTAFEDSFRLACPPRFGRNAAERDPPPRRCARQGREQPQPTPAQIRRIVDRGFLKTAN